MTKKKRFIQSFSIIMGVAFGVVLVSATLLGSIVAGMMLGDYLIGDPEGLGEMAFGTIFGVAWFALLGAALIVITDDTLWKDDR